VEQNWALQGTTADLRAYVCTYTGKQGPKLTHRHRETRPPETRHASARAEDDLVCQVQGGSIRFHLFGRHVQYRLTLDKVWYGGGRTE
jgi:hypothetical protein